MSDTPEQSPKAGQMTPAECGTKLKELFPALFGQDKPLPLKLRIQADIQERAPGVFTKPVLSAFLRRHTGSYAYLIGLTKATHRFDLDGQPAGELTEEHRQAASDELTRRRTVKNELRAKEEQSIRERAAVLRDFERTTLTPANFCALKGIAPETLDAMLAQARQDRIDHPELLAPKRHPDRRDHRSDKRPPGAGRPHNNTDRRGAAPQRNKPAPKTSA